MFSFIVLTLISLIIVQGDTIHFTNSKNYLINSLGHENFTKYQLDVPGSDPITIIEAHTEKSLYENDEDQFYQQNIKNHTVYSDSSEMKQHRINEDKLTVTGEKIKNVNRRTDRLNTILTRKDDLNENDSDENLSEINENIGDNESGVYNTMDDELSRTSNNNNKKTVYSPTLLKKFLYDYAERVKLADQSTKDKLQALIVTSSPSPFVNDNDDQEENFDDSEEQMKTSESVVNSQIEEKYGWDNTAYERPHGYNKRPYLQQQQQQQQHPSSSLSNRFPYNEHEGWVTLDAIPWSTSKVSKWHPNNDKVTSSSDGNYGGNKRPSSSSNAFWNDDEEHNYPKPTPSHNDGNFESEFEDSYYQHRPPAFHTSKPENPNYNYNIDRNHGTSRPYIIPTKLWSNNEEKPNHYNQRPNYDYHDRPSPHQQNNPNSYIESLPQQHDTWYNQGNKLQTHNTRPWQDDIITDTHSSSYPQKPPQKRPHNEWPNNQSQMQNQVRPLRVQHHPSSHPANGNGEWILVSTTKGYQFPPSRNGQRAIAVPANITTHKTVQLTVLPAKNSFTNIIDDPSWSSTTNKNTFSNTGNSGGKKKMPPSKVYGNRDGYEFENPDSIKDNQKHNTEDDTDDFKSKNTTKVSHTTRKKFLKGYPIKRKGAEQDSSAVLAAVGAGMVPATLAMLMPMALGRKKRDIKENNLKLSKPYTFISPTKNKS